MTTPAPNHPSYDLSFLGHLFTAANQLRQEQESGQPNVQQQKAPLADKHQSSSPSSPSDNEEHSGSKPHHIHHESPASVSVTSSLTGPNSSGSSPVSPIVPPARPSSHIHVQMSENEQCIRLRFNLKGTKNSDIYVGVQHGILMVQGTRFVHFAPEDASAQDDDNDSGTTVQRHRFCRRFAIDTDVVDISKIQANLSGAGILTVFAPKKSSPSTVRVNVTDMEDDKQEDKQEETSTKKPEGAQYDSIVSFLLDQANSAGRDNGMGGAVSVSSFSGSGSHSSGSHFSGLEDDEAMEDTPRNPSKKDASSQ